MSKSSWGHVCQVLFECLNGQEPPKVVPDERDDSEMVPIRDGEILRSLVSERFKHSFSLCDLSGGFFQGANTSCKGFEVP